MPRRGRGWAIQGEGRFEVRHTPLTVSMLEPVLLTLIQQKAQHGYSLLSELEALDLGTIHPSVVYRTLRELENLDWIESTWDTNQTQGPPRRTYNLTNQGKNALLTWQHELTKVQSVIKYLLDAQT